MSRPDDATEPRLSPAIDPAEAKTEWVPRPDFAVAPSPRPQEPLSMESFGPVKIVRGSDPSIGSEEQDLLRHRLRAFLLLLFIGFAMYFVRNLFLERFESTSIGVHLIITLILGAQAGLLFSTRPVTRTQLRYMELCSMIMIMAVFAYFERRILYDSALRNDALEGVDTMKSVAFHTYMLIVLYGLLIPNTIRRAAMIVIPISMVPPLTALAVHLSSPEVRAFSQQFATFERASDNAILLLLGSITALYGTHTIRNLRTEVREARQLGQYRLRRMVGKGGMGEVYLADHRLLKRPAAIKLIRPETAGDPQALARFEREVQATASLSHPNTVEVYDFGRADDGTFYYVMEYLRGMSLSSIVTQFGPLPPGRVVYLLRQACNALTEAHQLGLIHRDLKPGNIFAAHQGGQYDVAKLLDFGLVKPVQADPRLLELSHDGTVKGSPLYMSPEQATGKPLDPRCDLYAMGAVAYQILTGHPPFEGNTAVAVMVAHARDPVTPPSTHRPNLPADLEQVIVKCLAKSPDDRYQNAEDLERAFASCACVSEWSAQKAAAWWALVELPPENPPPPAASN